MSVPDFKVLSKIRLDLLSPNELVVVHAKQFDSIARVIEADLTMNGEPWVLPNGCSGIIGYTKPDGTIGLYDTLSDNVTHAVSDLGNGKIQIILADQLLTVDGNCIVEIKFFSDSARLSTFAFVLQVEKAAPNDNQLLSNDYFNILSQMIEGLIGATANPPYINASTRNWMIWDENQGAYADSGYSSVGEKGDPGPVVSAVTKVSGTGAPGTTDTYNVVRDDSRVVGTITVYNGEDGQGSPGQQLPLADGTASAGSAQAYSREDHVHPIQHDIPSGGSAGQIMKKQSSTNYDIAWVDDVGGIYVDEDPPSNPDINAWIDPTGLGTGEVVPPGGTIGQVLAKNSANSYDVSWTDLKGLILDIAHPVGCYYWSSEATSPATLFGGTWVAVEGKFILAASQDYAVGDTGGEAEHRLTIDEMPNHNHTAAIGATASGSATSNVAVGANTPVTWSSAHLGKIGGGLAHNNMPPYEVAYCWKRTA